MAIVDLLILTNGPGELATWVHPVVRQASQQLSEVRITVALLPCPYASGEEAASLGHWQEAVRAWSPRQTLRYLLTGRAPQPLAARGLVLFMGGDPAYGVWASLRTGYPLMAYTETRGRWAPFTKRFLLASRQIYLDMRSRRIPSGKLHVVGNLMADAVLPLHSPRQAREALSLRSDHRVVGLLPGSKPFKVRYMTPLLLKVAEHLMTGAPDTACLLFRSPTTPIEQLRAAAADEVLARVLGGTTGSLEEDQQGLIWLRTPGGVRIQVVSSSHPYEAMSVADLALTVPGTNTAELAILGVPMLVLMPLNRPEEIPMEGILNWLYYLPWVGKPLKAAIVRSLVRGFRFVALPNQRAGRLVTPEKVGLMSASEIAQDALDLLGDPMRRRQIRLELLNTMGPAGAAQAVVSQIAQQLFGVVPKPDLETPHEADTP